MIDKNTARDAVVDRVLALLRDGGEQAYFGEPVTQLEHALQAAALAEAAGASDALVVAALVHDIGHLVSGDTSDEERRTHDAHHEDVGHEWLAAHFGYEVTEPVRLHVAAKRYLCTVDAAYAEALSPASRDSLAVQGGPMKALEARAFEASSWAMDAAALRRWDDAAKIADRVVPGLSHYRDRLARLVRER